MSFPIFIDPSLLWFIQTGFIYIFILFISENKYRSTASYLFILALCVGLLLLFFIKLTPQYLDVLPDSLKYQLHGSALVQHWNNETINSQEYLLEGLMSLGVEYWQQSDSFELSYIMGSRHIFYDMYVGLWYYLTGKDDFWLVISNVSFCSFAVSVSYLIARALRLTHKIALSGCFLLLIDTNFIILASVLLKDMLVMALFILSLLFIVRILNNKYSKIDVFILLITIMLIATLRFHIVLLLILVSILYLLYFYRDTIIRINVIKILCLSIFAVVFSDVMVYQTSYLNGSFFLSGRLFINRGAELIFPNIFKKSVYIHDSGHNYIVSVPDEITKILYKANAVLTEDGKELFGQNVSHDDIRTLGQGRYSIWPGAIYFSTSDNTNPNTNDRNYEVKISDKYYSIAKLNDFPVSEVMKNKGIVQTINKSVDIHGYGNSFSAYMYDSGYSYIVAVPDEITKILYKANAVLMEDGKELFGRNVSHDDIRKLGQGRYSILPRAIYFSSSDNTNPNDRNYEVKINDKSYLIAKLNDFSVSELLENEGSVQINDIKKGKLNYVEIVDVDGKYKMDGDLNVLLEDNMPIMEYEKIADEKAEVKNEHNFKKANENSESIIKKMIFSLVHTCCAPYPWVVFSPGLTFEKFNELLLFGTFLWIISIPAFFMGVKHILSNDKIRRQVSFLLLWVFSITLLYIIIVGEFSTRQRQFVMPIIWIFIAVGYNLIFQRFKKISNEAKIFAK